MTAREPVGFTPLFTWLHLSDIHTGHGGAWRQADQELVLEQASGDIRRPDPGTPDLDAILITGDVAATGAVRARNEFKRFDAWLDPIRDHHGLEPGAVFAVPGNHDIQRESDAAGDADARRVIATLRRNGQIDEAIADSARRKVLRRRQSRFRAWSRRYGSATDTQKGTFTWRHRRRLGSGHALRLVGLDTALLCADNADRGKLELGSSQLVEALGRPEPDSDEIVIALGHHPFDWLRDEYNAHGWVSRRAHAYLSGHIHDQATERTISGSGRELISIAAGAMHEPISQEERHPRHGYNVASLGCDGDGSVVIRVWTRQWDGSEKRFAPVLAKDERPYAEHPVAGVANVSARRRPRGAAPRNTGKLEDRVDLDQIGRLTFSAAGRRRTAYPSDMSFQELHEQNLQIAPVLLEPRGELEVPELAERIRAGTNTLLLGAPGAGKSFASYLLLDSLGTAGTTAIQLDLRDLEPAVGDRRATRAVALRVAARRLTGTKVRVDDDRRDVVLILDGVDEALNTGQDPEGVATRVQELAKVGPLLVTCRTREYQDLLATRLTNIDLIVNMRPWDFHDQFVPFIGKLADAGRLEHPEDVVRAAEEDALRRLVTRPLFARMLTFVIETGGSVEDPPSLYREYLTALAKATEAGLVSGGHEPTDVYAQWRALVWWSFENGQVNEDGAPLTPILEFLVGRGIETGTALRLLSPIADTVQVFDELHAKFLHFTYFEYLLAEEAARRLRTDAGKPTPLGLRDLTVEVRHFMTAILAGTVQEALPAKIADSYHLSRSLPRQDRLTVNNLLVYVLARWPVPQPQLLKDLLEGEDEPFLRASLYWALARAGSEEALVEFVEVLRADDEMAELNRGYLLYYYGDLDRTRPPPYRDAEPHVPWRSTRRRIVEMMQEPGYAEVPATRQLLDVATFVDFLEVRGEEPTPAEHERLARVLDHAQDSHRSTPIAGLIADLRTRVGGTQLSWPLGA